MRITTDFLREHDCCTFDFDRLYPEGVELTDANLIAAALAGLNVGYFLTRYSYPFTGHLEYANGDREWWRNGRLHRDGDQPAFVRADGYQSWWRNGRLHRDGDQPAIVRADGYREWWANGKRLTAPSGN